MRLLPIWAMIGTSKRFLCGAERNHQRSPLPKISAALKILVEAIENFDEEQAVNVIASTFNDNAQVGAVINNYNPVDAVLKLHEEKMALYERMLKEKDEMMVRLEKLIK